MVDVKDKVNKPRRLRGTPSYAFVNKLTIGTIAIGGVIGLCMAYLWHRKDVKRPDYGKITLRDRYIEGQEARIRSHLQMRRDALMEKEEAEKDKEYMAR